MAGTSALLAIPVYNGRAFVPDCLRSAAALSADSVALDVLVLDDASPEEGFSDEIAALCRELGLQYYRSPRNLGIPRNFNLALLRGMDAGYDHTIIANSDVLFARNLVEQLVATAEGAEELGTVTAWSNDVAIYSLPNDAPHELLAEQAAVDWVGSTLGETFGARTVELPAGVGFLLLFPRAAIEAVGLMDPVFGRGYCEELDWCIRAGGLGLRNLLAPGAFAYHRGGGTNSVEGLLAAGHSSVPANEAIIDMRYPGFRSEVEAFAATGRLEEVVSDALVALLRRAIAEQGYELVLGAAAETAPARGPTVRLETGESPAALSASALGFRATFELEQLSAVGLLELFGQPPRALRAEAADDRLRELASSLGVAS